MTPDATGRLRTFFCGIVRGNHRPREHDSGGRWATKTRWLPRQRERRGRRLFVSAATNLTATDTNGVQDVFTKTVAANVTSLISGRP